MPRRSLILTNQFPYHVTARSNNKEWFYLPMDESWTVFTSCLAKVIQKYSLHAYAFVLMSNHFHFMLQTPLKNIGDVMRDFQTWVSKAFQRRTGRINHIFGNRYKWSILDSAYSVAYAFKYIYRNPVRAYITERVEDYPFSTLEMSRIKGRVPLVSGIGSLWQFVPPQYEERLHWLNQPTSKEAEAQITLGLRRAYFQLSKHNANQVAIRALKGSYGVERGDRYLLGPLGD